MQDYDARIAQLLAFYRSAYLADSRDLNLDNLSTLAAGRLAWLDGRDELASGALPLLALAPSVGAELERQQRLYQRELQLVYGVLPVCGRLGNGEGPATAFCAPLVYYEANLSSGSEGDAHLLAIDTHQPLLNWRLLRQLLVEGDNASLDDLPLSDAPIDAHVLGGERTRSGVNQQELEHVLQLIDEHIGRYADSPVKPSIGVVSPFRDQVEAIRQRIAGLDLQRLRDFRLLVDTPYGFQGEERDLMIISFAIDTSASQAAVYLNRQDMFNVAITRARERQVALFSGNERLLAEDHLLRRYLQSFAEQPMSVATQPDQDEFERALCDALQAQGVATWTRYPLAGLLLDVFCQRGDKCLAIDLIGFPGEGEGFLELERYRVLARAGLEIVPLSYALWSQEPEMALQALLKRL